MRLFAILITVVFLSPVFLACEKAVDKEAEEKIETLEKQVKVLEKKAAAPKVAAKPKAPAEKPKGWVRLYEHPGFKGQRLTVRLGQNIRNLNKVFTDEGKQGFNDKVSAVKHKIPDGWRVVLYEHENFTGSRYPLKSGGSTADVAAFNDKATSLRWEKI